MSEVSEGTDVIEELKEWYEGLDEHEDGGIYTEDSEKNNFAVSGGAHAHSENAVIEEYLDTRNAEGEFYGSSDEMIENTGFVPAEENRQIEQTNAGRLLKPEGHFHKPLIGIGVFLALALLFVIFGPSSNSTEEKIKVTSKAEKLPESKSSEELTGVTPGNTDDLFAGTTGNSNSQSGILGDSNSANTNPLLGNTNANSAPGMPQQPITTTKEYTTVQPVDGSGQPIQQNGSATAQAPARQSYQQQAPARQLQRENISDGFTVELGDESGGNRTVERTQTQPSRNQDSDTPVNQLRVMPGTKIEMTLDEPFRSGIESKVQATSLNNVKGTDGRILVPANSKFEISFRPEEIQGRVLAKSVIRVFLPNGSIGEIIGMIKGKDGYAGIGGRLTKQDGKGLSGSILGGIARVGSRMLGSAGSIGSDIGTEIQNSDIGQQDTRIYRSNRVVDVSGGTRFVIFIGTPE